MRKSFVDMTKAVVPVVGYPEGRDYPERYEFLGTSFFMQNPNALVTASHLIDNYSDLVIVPKDVNKPIPVWKIKEDKKNDIAILKVDEGYSPKYRLELQRDDEWPATQLVASLEYGTTQRKGKKTVFNPATRIGNITRPIYDFEWRNFVGSMCLELSFPAFFGACGAPILLLENEGFTKVVGMIVASVDRELSEPTVTTLQEDGEQIRRVEFNNLSQAVGICVNHIIDLVDSLQPETDGG